MKSISSIPIYSALNKPDLLLGGETKLVMLVGLFTFILVVMSMQWQVMIVGSVLWIVSMIFLRWMAAKDPIMSKVYLKHIKYQSYYPPASTPFRRQS